MHLLEKSLDEIHKIKLRNPTYIKLRNTNLLLVVFRDEDKHDKFAETIFKNGSMVYGCYMSGDVFKKNTRRKDITKIESELVFITYSLFGRKDFGVASSFGLSSVRHEVMHYLMDFNEDLLEKMKIMWYKMDKEKRQLIRWWLKKKGYSYREIVSEALSFCMDDAYIIPKVFRTGAQDIFKKALAF